MRAWVILFLAIASEVVGTVALKYAVDHFWIYGVAALCFILAFVLLSTASCKKASTWAWPMVSGHLVESFPLLCFCLLYTSDAADE